MGKLSKRKGAEYERSLARLFREYGYDTHRTAQYRGNTGQAGDIEGLPYIHAELKRRAHIAVYDWINQAVRDATAQGEGNLPAVFMRADDCDNLVLMRLTDWLQMYREYEASMSIKGVSE